jgi:hypothetical protein
VPRGDMSPETRFCELPVVPAAQPGASAHLAVGTSQAGTLHVVSLRDRALVAAFKRLVGSGDILGVATDPYGTALLDASADAENVVVPQWPLEGLPSLL